MAFGRTMLWKWLKRSCLQCTLQAAHFSLSVLKIDMTDHCLMNSNSIKTGQKAVSIDRMPKHVDEAGIKIIVSHF